MAVAGQKEIKKMKIGEGTSLHANENESVERRRQNAGKMGKSWNSGTGEGGLHPEQISRNGLLIGTPLCSPLHSDGQ